MIGAVQTAAKAVQLNVIAYACCNGAEHRGSGSMYVVWQRQHAGIRTW
jgi:hypothetical protein